MFVPAMFWLTFLETSYHVSRDPTPRRDVATDTRPLPTQYLVPFPTEVIISFTSILFKIVVNAANSSMIHSLDLMRTKVVLCESYFERSPLRKTESPRIPIGNNPLLAPIAGDQAFQKPVLLLKLQSGSKQIQRRPVPHS